jgi:hypothetical protein
MPAVTGRFAWTRRIAAAVVIVVVACQPVGRLDLSAFGAAPDNPGCPADPPNAFTDDGGNTHEFNINCIAFWQIAQGKGQGRYDPAGPVTRGQMATFIANMITRAAGGGGTSLPANAPDRFPDDNGNVHEAKINALAAASVVQGTADGTYRPNAFVTRAQMATFINNAIRHIVGTALTSSTDAFSDDNGNVHEPNINALAEARIVVGLAGGGYGPGLVVSRAQMATFIARTIGVLRPAGAWPDPDAGSAGPERFAGTYSGNWTNTTFGSSGSATMTVVVSGDGTVQLNIDINGDVFGSSDPPPATISGTATSNTASLSGTFSVFGPTTMTVNDGDVAWNSPNVPDPDIVSFTANGTLDETKVINLSYTMTFVDDGNPATSDTALGTIQLAG